jgi:protein PsiE
MILHRAVSRQSSSTGLTMLCWGCSRLPKGDCCCLIGVLAIVAVTFELGGLAKTGDINLADLLLLFIYLEVLGMAYAYYSTHSVPVTLPVLIAITGITRLILLSKDSEPTQLMYEAGAVLLLAIAYGALTWASHQFSRK